jgi:hypothetical protein
VKREQRSALHNDVVEAKKCTIANAPADVQLKDGLYGTSDFCDPAVSEPV